VPSAGDLQVLLGLVEGVGVDDRLVGRCVGGDPLVLRVPPHPGLVAERDVIDVDEDLVLALAVPDLYAGVAGVGQDRPNGSFGPGDAGPVRIAGRVVRGR
jgi:hypothetical protein